MPAPPTPSAAWALFLDVDGTVVDLAERPDAAAPRPDTPALLASVARGLNGALMLVSGRTLADLDRMFGAFRPPASGVHGLEWRDETGAVHRAPVNSTTLAAARAALEAYAERATGVLVEDKGPGLAVHYRLAPERAHEVRLLLAEQARTTPGFHVLEGKMVMELRPDDVNKGTVVEAAMGRPPFAGRHPVFVGDDITDEDGFAAVNRMGGTSIRIGPGPTAARYTLDSVDETLEWLRTVARIVDADGAPNG